MTKSKKCVCGNEMTPHEWSHRWVCHYCGRTKPFKHEEPEYRKAEQFLEKARERVLAIAQACDFNITLHEYDDDFLYDLFIDGTYAPTDEEIIEALEEFAFE